MEERIMAARFEYSISAFLIGLVMVAFFAGLFSNLLAETTGQGSTESEIYDSLKSQSETAYLLANSTADRATLEEENAAGTASIFFTGLRTGYNALINLWTAGNTYDELIDTAAAETNAAAPGDNMLDWIAIKELLMMMIGIILVIGVGVSVLLRFQI
jgi:hypothetical protein